MKTTSWGLAASKLPLLYLFSGEKAPPGSSAVLAATMRSGCPGLRRSRYPRLPHISGSSGLTGVDWLGVFLSSEEMKPWDWASQRPQAEQGLVTDSGLSRQWQPMTYLSATHCHCKNPLNQSLGVWQIMQTVGKKDKTGGYKQLAEVI